MQQQQQQPLRQPSLAHSNSLISTPSISFSNLPIINQPSRTQSSSQNHIPSVSGFNQICRLQLAVRFMLQDYCTLVEKLARIQKNVTEDQIKSMVADMQDKYQCMMKILQKLPAYDQRTVEQYQKQVLRRHQLAAMNFKTAINRATVWKKQIHSVINYELQNGGQ